MTDRTETEQMGKKLRILAVEDDDSISRLLRMIYAGSYDLDTAGSVRSASDLLRRKGYDAMVLDVELPDGLGTDLLRSIRQDSAFAACRDIPVVMLTSSEDAGVYESAWDLGSIAYVKKPFEVDDLSTAIEQAVAQRGVAA
jgi:DNA-binding response OmpR family regulator